MRITITDSARKHAITDDEIRCVIEYPILTVPIVARIAADATLYVGRYDDNEPLIEVVALQDGETLVAFHAMHLTRSTIRLARIESFIDPADLAHTQRR